MGGCTFDRLTKDYIAHSIPSTTATSIQPHTPQLVLGMVCIDSAGVSMAGRSLVNRLPSMRDACYTNETVPTSYMILTPSARPPRRSSDHGALPNSGRLGEIYRLLTRTIRHGRKRSDAPRSRLPRDDRCTCAISRRAPSSPS